MTFFKYKWQVFLVIALFFGSMILLNRIALQLFSFFDVALAYITGAIFAGILLYLRRKENWFQKLE